MGPEMSHHPGIWAHNLFLFFFSFPGADVSLGAAACTPVHVPSGRFDAKTHATATQATLKPHTRSIRVQATCATREVGMHHQKNRKQVFDTSGWFVNASGPSLRIATERSEYCNFVLAKTLMQM